jgi:FtsX-like permease family/PQQ-like domain
LPPAWSYKSGINSTFQATPIVADGTMYVSLPFNHVVALDARNGKQLWRYEHKRRTEKMCCGPANRGVAVAYGRVFIATVDARLIALDQQSGKPVWDVPLVDELSGETERSEQLAADDANRNLRVSGSTGVGASMAPLVYKGRVIVGITGVGYGLHLDSDRPGAPVGAVLGDRFRVQSAQGNSEVLRIRALLDLGSRDLNRRYVYSDLRTAQSLFGIPGRITNLDISVREMMRADEVAARLRIKSGQLVESWIQNNNFIFTAINNQNIMTTLIKVFITIVVALGIASVLVVSVVQKRKEIGILRAVGATRRQMQSVFLLQGLMVGVSGAALGSALGYLLILIFSRVLRNAEGQSLFSLHFDVSLIGIVVLAAAVLGLLSAVLPARNAARLDPAQAIRG